MPKVLIKNGLVISPTGVIANDVLIDGEKIAAVGAPGWFASSEQGCDRVIDAAGKYVIPGGVDVHTHMELPFGGTFASDTFETGSRAAAWGGVTTIIDMAVQRYGENVFDGLAEWHRKASGECAIDYAFHQIIGGVDDQSLKDMKYLTEHEGISSFKLFMAYPGVFLSSDGQIVQAMQQAMRIQQKKRNEELERRVTEVVDALRFVPYGKIIFFTQFCFICLQLRGCAGLRPQQRLLFVHYSRLRRTKFRCV